MRALPSSIARLLRPEAGRPVPEPAQVDLRKMLVVGAAVWTVALIVFVVLGLASDGGFGEPVAVCVAGLVLAGAGFLWEHAHRSQYRPAGKNFAAGDERRGSTTGREASAG